MRFSDLQGITKGKISVHEDLEVARFSTDTRTLSGSDNEVFVASLGKRDGHDFIQSAIEKGVRNFIVEKDIKLNGFNHLAVESSIQAFHSIATSHRQKFSYPVIAITGSNGKTTVKEWLSTLLSEKYFVVKNPKSYNSQVGAPMSVMEMRENHDVGIFEAGISETNEMVNLAKVIQPTMGLFTTLGEAHNEGFESKDQKLQEKLKLFEKAEKLVFRGDQKYSSAIESNISAKAVKWVLEGVGEYTVNWDDGIAVNDHKFYVSFNGDTYLENATHAIVMALEMGLSHDQIQSGLNRIRPIPMRLVLKKGINGCYLLDDSYNNDLIGLKVALDYLQSHRQNDKRTLILSDILQSGMSDELLYQSVTNLLKERNIDRLIGVGPRISSSKKHLPPNTLVFSDTDELLNNLPHFENEMIVIKGARDFALEHVVKELQEKSHGTILEVNFEALQHNLNQYRDILQPKTKLMAMVKANAYGSGILEVGNFLQHQRVDQLGVAYVDEAIQLRKNGVDLPIMIMNPYIESFSEFEKYDLQAEIFSLGHLKRLLSDTVTPPPIHVKIDTGMHRLGFDTDEIPSLIAKLAEHPELKVAGIFTHFASSENSSDDDFTIKQAELFEDAYERLSSAIGYRPVKHACNSSAMVRWRQYHYDMVRLGIGLYGYDPTKQLKLRPVGSLKTTISQIQELAEGETVGYSRSGILKRNSRVAILPVGYEDGYLRVFGNGNGKVNIGGQICPTIGNICMDMTMVDVTDTDAKEGDEVIVFGSNPDIIEVSKWGGTMPYEILTNISSRVKRLFVSE